MKIKVYYCDYKNFGDQLNRYIFPKFLECEVCWSPYEKSTIMGIGSIIEAALRKSTNKTKRRNEPVYCFSSGFAKAEQINEFTQSATMQLIRPVKFIALRGEKTKKLLVENGLLAVEESPVLGDGGLLASSLIDKVPEKKYKVGIVSHAQETSDKRFKELHEKIPESTLLNIQEDTMDFLIHVAECETIISSAMHPLIVADSLGIPNMWIRLEERYCATDRFKFDDYYSVYGVKMNPVFIDEITPDVYNTIINNYVIPQEKVDKIKKELIGCIIMMRNELWARGNELKKEYFRFYFYMLFIFYPHRLFCEYPKRMINKLKRIFPSKTGDSRFF